MFTQALSQTDAFTSPSQTLRLSRKQSLFHHGDPAHSVYRLRDGLIRITKMTPEGRNLTVRHVLPGDFFGEEALTNSDRAEAAEALTQVNVEAIDPNMIAAADLMTITRSISTQMQRLMDYEYHLQTGDLRQRVARYLIKLSTTPLATTNEAGQIMVSASHELIAEGTASTRESVSKIISELREDGLINSGYRNITLTNIDELDMLAEGF